MRRRQVVRTFVALGASVALLGVACGGDAGDTATNATAGPDATAGAEPETCAYAFDATVRSGPTADRSLRGLLLMTRHPDGSVATLFARRVDGEPQVVPSAASIEDGEVTFAFGASSGVVLGTGPVGEGCGEVVEGDLTGPVEGDRGDWAGITTPETTGEQPVPIPGLGAINAEAAGGLVLEPVGRASAAEPAQAVTSDGPLVNIMVVEDDVTSQDGDFAEAVSLSAFEVFASLLVGPLDPGEPIPPTLDDYFDELEARELLLQGEETPPVELPNGEIIL